MRDKMRQLLSRKSHPKLSGEDAQSSKSEPFPPSGDLTGQRTFPIRNQRENGDVLGLFPTVKVDVSAILCYNIQTLLTPLSRNQIMNELHMEVSLPSRLHVATMGPTRLLILGLEQETAMSSAKFQRDPNSLAHQNLDLLE